MRRFCYSLYFVSVFCPSVLLPRYRVTRAGWWSSKHSVPASATDMTLAGVLSRRHDHPVRDFRHVVHRLSRNLGLAMVNPGSTQQCDLDASPRRRWDDRVLSRPSRSARVSRCQVHQRTVCRCCRTAAGFRRQLCVTSDSPVAVIGLRFRGPVFSTIPVTSLHRATPVAADEPGSRRHERSDPAAVRCRRRLVVGNRHIQYESGP